MHIACIELRTVSAQCSCEHAMARNIVEYIGVGYRQDAASEEDPAAGCYLVQEFVDGGTLKQKILSRVSHAAPPCLMHGTGCSAPTGPPPQLRASDLGRRQSLPVQHTRLADWEACSRQACFVLHPPMAGYPLHAFAWMP